MTMVYLHESTQPLTMIVSSRANGNPQTIFTEIILRINIKIQET